MLTKSHYQGYQVATERQHSISSCPNPLTSTAFVPSQKISSTSYSASLENPHNILTNSIEQLFYNASVSTPFDLRVLQYACFQCKTRLVKHISNLNSRYTNPNLAHELCTPCKYVFLSISQKNSQKLKPLPHNTENSLDSNPLQSTLLNDVFFSVPSPEKFENDDLELMKYDPTSSWAATNSPTLSPTDFLIDEGENLFGFDLDPDFSSDQSTFGSSDTESSETASLHSPRSTPGLKQTDNFESISPPLSPLFTETVDEETLDSPTVDEKSVGYRAFHMPQEIKRPSSPGESSSYSTHHSEQKPSKISKLTHEYSMHSNRNAPTPKSLHDHSDEYNESFEEDAPVDRHVEQVTPIPETEPRTTSSPTIFESLAEASVDWCRYCGTTEGVNWRPGPWGKRTLCNKHGCDYKGYGFACKLPRLNLTAYVGESIEERIRPVLQHFCSTCQKQESYVGNVMVMCEGCPKAFHQKCFPDGISDEIVNGVKPWFCDGACTENIKKRRIVVELPRKRLPLMCSPKSTSDATKPKTVVRSESPRKPQTRKTAKSLPTYETKSHRRTTSKTQSVARNTTSLADEESYSDISSSRRVAPRSSGKNLTHYALLSRTANYYEASSDSSEDA